MQQNFSTAKLGEWISNFNPNDGLPFVTRSGLIELDDLEDFIKKIKALQADSVRVYFIRLQANETPPTAQHQVNGKLARGCEWHNAGAFTQGTIALVPAKNFQIDDDFIFSADDITVGSGIVTLMPGIESKGTGLCPPSCPKSTVGGH